MKACDHGNRKYGASFSTSGCVLVFSATASACLLAAGEADTPTRGEAAAVCVEKGPPLDGTLKDPLWQKATLLPMGACTRNDPQKYSTEARILFDSRNAYLGVYCAEPQTAQLDRTPVARDGDVWKADVIEIFIRADPEEPYQQFAVAPSGAMADLLCRGPGLADPKWNSSAEAKATVEDGKGWTVTLRLPLKDLNAYVGVNETWTLNVYRTRPARGDDPILEYAWAIMASNSFNVPGDFGIIKGVNVPKSDDGVARMRKEPAPSPKAGDKGKVIGGVTVYKHWDEVTIKDGGNGVDKEFPCSISQSPGLKIAFVARGSGGVKAANINLYDRQANNNTLPYGAKWLGEPWRPILYRADRFNYNGTETTVAKDTEYTGIRFWSDKTPDSQGTLYLRDFTIYRGDDRAPPEAPTGLTAKAEDDGVHLSWKPAQDNAGVALYVISRAKGGEKFAKVGQSCTPDYADRPPDAGTYRYRVLAVDFERNLGPWSPSATAEVPKAFPAVPPSVLVKDSQLYASQVRAIQAAGAGKVEHGTVLVLGDGAAHTHRFRDQARAMLGLYYGTVTEISGLTTTAGRKRVVSELTAHHPEVCVLLLGTDSPKSTSEQIQTAMDDILAMAKTCEEHGAIPILSTILPQGFAAPDSRNTPEARFNEALVKLCRENKLPVAYVFETYLDGGKISWPEISALAILRAALDQVEYVLLDRPE